MTTYFHGTRTLTDSATGEVFEAQTITKSVGDAGFHKIWLHHILELVDQVGNDRMKVLMWLLTNADGSNRILATHAEIATGAGCSTKTVQRLMKAMKDANVIAEQRRSLWLLNPNVIFKGGADKRQAVLIRYNDERQADLFNENEEVPAVSNVRPLRAA